MEIPTFLYGQFRQVKLTCKKKVRQFLAGAPIAELVDIWMDTKSHQGMLVLEGPSSSLGSAEHFHLFAFVRLLREAIREGGGLMSEQIAQRAMAELLTRSWGFLAVVGQDSYIFCNYESCARMLIDAIPRYWAEVDGEGNRYSCGLSQPSRLWENCQALLVALHNAGVPASLIQNQYRRDIPGLALWLKEEDSRWNWDRSRTSGPPKKKE